MIIYSPNKLLNLLRGNFPNRSVITTFATYAIGSLLLRGISIFIFPIIIRHIPPADYGILSLATAFITIGTAIIGLGLRQVVSLEYFHYHHEQRTQLISEILIIYTVISLPVCLLGWYLRSFLIRFIFFNDMHEVQLLALFLHLFFFFYAELLYQLLQYAQRARLLITIQMCIALLTCISTLLSVWYLHAGITGILWAQAISQIIGSIFALFYLSHYFHYPLFVTSVFKKISYYLTYGAPFIPGILCSWILASSDRWMLGYFCSMREVGIYAVADLFAQLFNSFILIPWSGSYLPHIMQHYKHQESSLGSVEHTNQKIMWASLASLTLIILIGFTMGKPLLYWVLPATYHPALSYVLILIFGQLALLGSYFSSALIQFKKRTTFLALALALPAGLNIALNALLIPLWGIYGCSFATLISYVIYFMITYRYNRKLIYSPAVRVALSGVSFSKD